MLSRVVLKRILAILFFILGILLLGSLHMRAQSVEFKGDLEALDAIVTVYTWSCDDDSIEVNYYELSGNTIQYVYSEIGDYIPLGMGLMTFETYLQMIMDEDGYAWLHRRPTFHGFAEFLHEMTDEW